MHIIIGSIISVVSSALAGIGRFSSSAAPKPTTTWPATETSTYFAVSVKLFQIVSSASSSR